MTQSLKLFTARQIFHEVMSYQSFNNFFTIGYLDRFRFVTVLDKVPIAAFDKGLPSPALGFISRERMKDLSCRGHLFP